MQRKSKIWNAVVLVVLGGLVAGPSWAVEIITRDDIVNNVVKKNQLVKVADNAIFLLDTSSSANRDFADTDRPVVQVVTDMLKARNAA